ncbi:putative molybdopterin-guanine dinucleotide biosynthesis protein A [Gordonia polyisoprenivorans VH2]|uniref:Probable molybdenum cofactor guanylyltransferase n=2 Tax=Gordonia polyisoprenivorans TaxID=84595 RepID=H6MX69_GORPV|nr:putative molybdopterin-guanine dinucleotide biosynthesis protein A [Gordonia polyisoprenivorans VH2]
MVIAQTGPMTAQTNDRHLAGLVLAGGRSRRMGHNKAAMDWEGQPMLASIVEVLNGCCDCGVFVAASTGSPAYQELHGTGGPPAQWVTGEQQGAGPLGGLAAGLATAGEHGAEMAFVCATDMPMIAPGLVAELSAAMTESTEAVVAHDADRDHPMAAIYRVGAASTVAALVESGERRMTAALDALVTRRITVSDPSWLINVNAPEDLHRLRALAP